MDVVDVVDVVCVVVAFDVVAETATQAFNVSPCAMWAGTAGAAMLMVCWPPLPVLWQTSIFCWPVPALVTPVVVVVVVSRAVVEVVLKAVDVVWLPDSDSKSL